MAGRLRLLLLAICLLLPAAGCAPRETEEPPPESAPTDLAEAPKAKPFTLPYHPAASFHPITGENQNNLILANLVYQGLFELDNDFVPHGVLCKSWTVSADGLVWTFALADAVFSDGSPLTAADAADSLELARTSPLYAARLEGVRTVAPQEDGTVTVTLSSPDFQLPALLDIPVVREGAEAVPLGTGPYFFAGEEEALRLVRRADAPKSAPEEIPLYGVQSADELIYAFDAGEISLVASDLTGANALGYSTGYEAFDYPTTTLLYVGLRTNGGACGSNLIRQAIAKAFDRDTVTASLLAGHAEAAALPVSPRSELYDQEIASAGVYDPAGAAALLEQAGYTRGEDGLFYRGRSPLTLLFIVNTDNTFKLAVAEYLCGQLADLGISAALQKLSWSDYLSALESGEFDLYLGEVTLTAGFDLSPLVSQVGALNYGGYSSGEADGLLAALRQTDQAGRQEAARALYSQLQADVPLVPLCFKSGSVLTQWGAVSGLQPTRKNPFYQLEQLRFKQDYAAPRAAD